MQWRTQKIFAGGIFIQWHTVVICIWCALFLTSYSCFQAKFVDTTGIFFYTHFSYFCKKSSPIHSPYDKVFAKYQAQWGLLTPTPLLTLLCTCKYQCACAFLHGLLHATITAKATLHKLLSISFWVRTECLNVCGEAFLTFFNINVFFYSTTTSSSLQCSRNKC